MLGAPAIAWSFAPTPSPTPSPTPAPTPSPTPSPTPDPTRRCTPHAVCRASLSRRAARLEMQRLASGTVYCRYCTARRRGRRISPLHWLPLLLRPLPKPRRRRTLCRLLVTLTQASLAVPCRACVTSSVGCWHGIIGGSFGAGYVVNAVNGQRIGGATLSFLSGANAGKSVRAPFSPYACTCTRKLDACRRPLGVVPPAGRYGNIRTQWSAKLSFQFRLGSVLLLRLLLL